MDFLKIRKKQRDEAAASESSSSSPESPSPPSSSPPAPPPSRAREPAAPRSRAPERSSPTSSSSPPSPPPAARARPAASAPKTHAPARSASPVPHTAPPKGTPQRGRAPEPAVQTTDDDPLLEFLARYDEGSLQTTLGSTQETDRDESKRYLAFELAGEEYAASIMDIREILRVLALTGVPRAPREILGVISKRGLVMPVTDLAATLGLREPDERWTPRQRILVVGDGDRVCGLRVDRVLEVVRLRAQDVEEVPASLGARTKHQLRGLGRVGERMFILLDVPAVLHSMAIAAGLESHEEVA